MAKKYNWKPSFSVGNLYIDNQHKVIFNLIAFVQQLAEASEPDKKMISHSVSKLVQFAKSHFTDEEEMMDRHNYASLEKHKALHRNLLDKTNMLVGKLENGGLEVLPILTQFLNDWLLSHILGVDMKYKPYLGTYEKPYTITAPNVDAENIMSFVLENFSTQSHGQDKETMICDTDDCIVSADNSEIIERYLNKEYLQRTDFVYQDTTIIQTLKILKQKNITNVLVVDSSEKILGIVTEGDIVKRYSAVDIDERKDHNVGAIATRPLKFIRVEYFFEDLQKYVYTEKIRHFPVVKNEICQKNNLVSFLGLPEVVEIAAGGFILSSLSE